MAFIGLKYPVFAPITAEADGALPTYGTGMVMGKAIKVDVSWESDDVKLYADDALAERANEVKSGTVTINTDDLSDTILNTVLGYAAGASTGEYDEISEVAPYGGFGYYRKRILNGVTSYIAYWCFKVQFSLPNDTAETAGESTNFSTPELSGSILGCKPRADMKTSFRRHKTFTGNTAEADAVTWLKGLANIT